MSNYPTPSLHIGGEALSAKGRDTFDVLNPATGDALAGLPLATSADLDRALETAERMYPVWRAVAAEERGKVLIKAAALMRERADEIARNATREEGKPFREARMETLAGAACIEFLGEEARRSYGRVLVRPSGVRAMVVKEPVGPVAAFAPWNFPVGNPCRKFGAAIAAGCSIILKPAEEAPASALAVLQCLHDAGLPQGVAQIVFGVPDQVSRHLLASPIIRKLSFTGSVPVGKQLMKLAADTMKRTTMELGGHAPVIVFEDAEQQATADLMAAAKWRNAGQVCVSPTRYYVQESVYQKFVECFVARAKSVRVGDGLDEATNMGPMANPRRPQAIQALLEDAVKEGGKVRAGGKRIGNQGFFHEPTVITDVPLSARIMNEEPFGPVAIVTPFATFDEVVKQANRLPYGLAAYAFTQSNKTAMLIGDAIEAGMVAINTDRIAGADSPFGGVKESGHGAEDGPEGLDACLVTKTITQH